MAAKRLEDEEYLYVEKFFCCKFELTEERQERDEEDEDDDDDNEGEGEEREEGENEGDPAAQAAAPKVVTLTRWYPKVLPPHLRLPAGTAPISVEGLRIDPKSGNELERWHSSAIATRQSARELLTSSGSLYVLQGPLDAALCTQFAEVDAPDASVLAAFADGFLESWRELSAAAAQQHRSAQEGGPSPIQQLYAGAAEKPQEGLEELFSPARKPATEDAEDATEAAVELDGSPTPAKRARLDAESTDAKIPGPRHILM
ncbi:hypothetical protein T492DRAFT_839317 [Pavlovales sp. CCMP2436]|nr:hypothetical protein T492DRAFT_839317 [Pavlovales sp. CCMP2436]